MERTTKTVKDSYTVMTEMVQFTHVNGFGRLFGGQLMSWMDVCGGVCAKRHSNCDVVTASVEKLEFLRPGLPGDVVVIKARMYQVGNSSMKVEVTADIEKNGDRKDRERTCVANFVFVAMDEDGVPVQVPSLVME